jgi:hypothetical protein
MNNDDKMDFLNRFTCEVHELFFLSSCNMARFKNQMQAAIEQKKQFPESDIAGLQWQYLVLGIVHDNFLRWRNTGFIPLLDTPELPDFIRSFIELEAGMPVVGSHGIAGFGIDDIRSAMGRVMADLEEVGDVTGQ